MHADLLAAGRVTSPHGITGAVKVKTFAESTAHLLSLEEAVFRKGAQERTLRIVRARQHPLGLILEVEGVTTPEKARSLVGSEMWVPRKSAGHLAAGEYYEADLCRCSLWLGEEEIGPVRSVLDGGSVQLLEVTAKDGKSRLVPFTDHFVGTVDIARGHIELKEEEVVR